MDELINFLIRAKQATYAGNGAHVSSCRPCSKDLSYQDGELSYYDTYLGGSHFIGEEAVWCAGIPYWAMNYSGRLLDDSFSFDFLKEALLHASPEMPYRGPALYQRDEFFYKCTVNGDFSWFLATKRFISRSKKFTSADSMVAWLNKHFMSSGALRHLLPCEKVMKCANSNYPHYRPFRREQIPVLQ